MIVVAAMVLTFSTSVARAQTNAELQAQITALLAQIAQLQAQLQGGGSVAPGVCPYVWQRDLGQGSSGVDVMRLQQFLNNVSGVQVATAGAGSPGMETQYYGPRTAAAVSQFQLKYRSEILTPIGLVNPTGYFGAMSRAKANDLCVTTTVPPVDDDDDDVIDDDDELRGGAGSISDADWVSGLNNEEVGEDEEDVEVAGLEIEPSGSDIALRAVRVVFDHQENVSGSSDDFDDYAEEVSLWLDGEEIARADADEFNEDDDGVYARTFSIDESDAIIREDDVEDLVVAVSAVGNLDSSDEGEDWTVEFDSVRFRDAQGAIITDTATGDIGDTRQFSFEEFAAAAGLEVHISNGDDAINDARIINVDDNDETEEVEVFSFEVEIEGNSDVTIEDLVIAATTTGAADLGEMASQAQLLVDGDEVGTENIGSTDTITFDNIDVELEAGETYEFILALDFLALDDALDEGDTVSFFIRETQRDAWDVEDETGNDVADNDITGTASTEEFVIYESAFDFNLVSTSATVSGGDAGTGTDDTGTFRIVYDLTAVDDDVSIAKGCLEDQANVPDQGTEFTIENEGSNTTNCTVTSTADTNPSDSGAWIIDEGDTERFTLTVAATATADHFTRVYLTSINWDDDTTDTTPDLFYTAGLGESNTATDTVYLNEY